MPEKRSLAERFVGKYEPCPATGCWLWTAAVNPRGYGAIAIRRSRAIGAHVASWLIHFGAVSDGKRVCHRCDVESCVNPAHLFLGTAKENTQDMIKKGRHKFGTWNAPRGNNHWRRKGKA